MTVSRQDLQRRAPRLTDLQRALVVACLGMLAVGLPQGAQASPVIKWRVENPFRLFTDPADTEVHRATFKSLSAEDRRNPVLAAERALQSRHSDGWAATMYRKTCWDWKKNVYRCPEYADYMNPDSHRVIARDRRHRRSRRSDVHMAHGAARRRQLRGRAITQPCSEPLAVQRALSRRRGIKVEIGGREVLQADIKVSDILVVGMGDSFASGEGNPDVPVRFSRERTAELRQADANADLTGYPARIGNWKRSATRHSSSRTRAGIDQACHRSLYSHQLRAALQLAVEDPHRAVTFVGLACSGAEVTFGLFLRYKGNEWVPNPPELSQISAVAEAQCGNKQSRGDRPARSLPHERAHLGAEGRSGAAQVSQGLRAQDRSGVGVDRRQRRRLFAPRRQRGAAKTSPT